LRTAFVTGATGFLGSHVANLLLQHGWSVRALVRRPARPGLLPQGVRIVAGELLAADRYREALRNCHAVIHVAGLIQAPSLAAYRRANAQGTAILAEAAQRVCPDAMFLLVSSQAAAGPSMAGRIVRESDPPRPISWYGRSKLEGEQELQRRFRGRWCIVRPSVVYGPGDRGLLKLFQTADRGLAPILAGGDRMFQMIAAEDVARMLVALLDRPDMAGRCGFAAGEAVTTGQVIREVASWRRPPARCLPIPGWVVRMAGMVGSLAQSLGIEPVMIDADKAREILAPGWVCDPAPLLRDLGIAGLEPWRAGLRRTVRWYCRHGWLLSDWPGA